MEEGWKVFLLLLLLLQNCKALQEPRFRAHRSYLFIDNVTHDDEGDYTCQFTHAENGTNYIVTATRSFTVEGKLLASTRDKIQTNAIRETCALLVAFPTLSP